LKGLSPQVQAIFRNYEWKGNVRELRNVIERASILEDNEYVTTAHLPADMLAIAQTVSAGNRSLLVLPEGGVDLEMVEFDLCRQAMERTGGNLTQAARLLNISRDQLRYKLRKAGLYDEMTGDESGKVTV
jgi:DNA-binding NtrC family response regulator